MHPLHVWLFDMHPLSVCVSHMVSTWLYLGSCACMANPLLSELFPLPCISSLFVNRPINCYLNLTCICPQTMTDSYLPSIYQKVTKYEILIYSWLGFQRKDEF